MQIKTIDQLRDHALKTLERLENGQIDTAEAGVTGKLCEGVISTIKAQMEYARMLGLQPKIKFMGDLSKNKLLAVDSKKDIKLLNDK